MKNLQVKRSHVRWTIILMLFIVSSLNYADRAAISIGAPSMQNELGISAVALGYIFSAFSWAYVGAQIPGGWLLDRFGSKKIYFLSIFFWSLFTLFQGFVGFLVGAALIVTLFILRFLTGLAEAPAYPANSRITASWFPTKERGTAASIFSSAQYGATVIFSPLMAYVTQTYGWKSNFILMGTLGIVLSMVWLKSIYSPKDHPRINKAELEYIEQGGAMVDLDTKATLENKESKWPYIRKLLKNRMMMGIFFGQYCINVMTYFFLTWFPIYLVKDRGMSILKAGFVASLPALCGFAASILSGIFSDYLLKKGCSLTVARKVPIIAGMLMSMTIIGCNYVNSEGLVIFLMSLAFFGKGFGALGWCVVSDVAPKEALGISGGLLNTFGNIAGIITPIVIGYIIQGTGSFNLALVYVGIHALAAILCYLLIVGRIERFKL
ncbi:MFS transporter [Paenibacillus oralis]|uniref:MFS transporter n=1 Tax=Paenibacillus oralis TaxID=2490856 RepID=A0A3P3U459_9BACL|nr:MFS transporter [Paenibacillus oralis]RRJ65025.1 MFS transporter [Paenibacillus oralis]